MTFCIDYADLPDEPDSISLDVSMKDTGIGIKKKDLQKLFSEFERIEVERNRKAEGTGLGMRITKRLLEMMGSTLYRVQENSILRRALTIILLSLLIPKSSKQC